MSESPDFQRSAEALIERIRREIPLTAAMQLSALRFDGHELVLGVPLGANFNDKGTAFAGSITALGSITGWCLLTLWAEREIGACQLAIYDAHFTFRKPLKTDFTASVSLPPAEECEALRQSLEGKGKGKISLRIGLADAEGEAAVLTGAYALWRV